MLWPENLYDEYSIPVWKMCDVCPEYVHFKAICSDCGSWCTICSNNFIREHVYDNDPFVDQHSDSGKKYLPCCTLDI
jgi:hypothetical protein